MPVIDAPTPGTLRRYGVYYVVVVLSCTLHFLRMLFTWKFRKKCCECFQRFGFRRFNHPVRCHYCKRALHEHCNTREKTYQFTPFGWFTCICCSSCNTDTYALE